MGAPSADVPRPGGNPAPSGPTSMSHAAISPGVAGRPIPKVAGADGAAFAGAAGFVCAARPTLARPAATETPMTATTAARVRADFTTTAPRRRPPCHLLESAIR